MLIQKFIIAFLLICTVVQVHSTSSKVEENENHATKRTGRIMKILKDSKINTKHIRSAQNPQLRRDTYPPIVLKHPLPIVVHRHPAQPPFGGLRNQVLRRVQNGPPPPGILLRPQHHLPPQPKKTPIHRPMPSQPKTQQLINYEQGKKTYQHPLSGKEHVGKGAVYRPNFATSSHPNALQPGQSGQSGQSGHPQQSSSPSQSHSQFSNFKPSPQFSGPPIVRPASDYPQYDKLLQEYTKYEEIQQYPLPEKHPQHQHQHQHQLQTYTNQHSNIETTAPQTFPSEVHQQAASTYSYTEPLLQSLGNNDSTKKMYSVYEEPETNERAPIQFKSQQKQPIYNYNSQPPPHPHTQQQRTLLPEQSQSSQKAAKEAEEYLSFMSTNEYFLPKFNPNYKKLDEEKDFRQYRQQLKPSQQYSNTHPVADTSGASTFQHPIEISQLYYKPDASSTSTLVRGSYQAGNNAFIVKSDGNKASKHVVSNSVPAQVRTTPSSITGSYAHLHFNSQRQQTPEPIRFEFTERDAVLPTHTNAPPSSSNSQLRYKSVVNGALSPVNSGAQSHQDLFDPQTLFPTSTFISHSRPIAVNEVDADPEDGDDMQDTSSTTYGRVQIRTSTENISVSAANDSTTSTTPAIEQKDTEDYCERICANVQDNDEEIVCGSDGYMYTSEAQMECYASCLHIDVTIQGKGTCSAR